jgi:ATP/maltotriose-dependent transcriptional regulator MalT
MPPNTPIRSAKLRPPVVAGDFVLRERLTEALRKGIEGPLTLVCAPAGYGKTSLVSNFVEDLADPVAWVSLDGGDATPARLVRLIVIALRGATPEFFPEIESLLAAPPEPAELAARLADEIDEMDADVVLVLDELERAGGAAVHDFLSTLLEYPPRPLRLVVTTRHDPPWPLATLRARGLMHEIRQADLVFSAAEAKAFVEQASGSELDAAALGLLLDRTEGWPAAIRMISLALGTATSAGELLDRLPRGMARVEEYLTDAVLARQPDDVRHHLLRVSIVERLHRGLCDALRRPGEGGIGGAALLDHMRRGNLFVSEDDGQWLRLHPLLREHLAHTLHATAPETEIRSLHDCARDWFNANGLVAEAIEHALQGSRPATAADVLHRHRVDLMNADRQREIDGWIARIRSETGENGVALRVLDAWEAVPMSELPAALDGIDAELQTALLPPEERAAFEGEVHGLRALDLGARREFEEASKHGAAALRMIPRSATAARANTYFAQATNAQAAGDAAMAHRVVAAGLEEMAGDGGVALATVLYAGACVHWNEGELGQAIAVVERALSACNPDQAPSARITLRTQAGMAHYRRNALCHAEELLRGSGLETFPPAQHAVARTLAAAGRSAEADDAATGALRHAAVQRDAGSDHLARALIAELALRRGNLAEARAWADGVRDEHLGGHSTVRPVGIVLAAVLADAGDEVSLARADEVVDRLVHDARRVHRVPVVAEALAIRSAVAAKRKDEPAVLCALGQALELTRRGSMIRTYLDLAPRVVPFLRHPEIPAELRAHALAIEQAAGAGSEQVARHSPQVLADDLTNREEDVLELLADRLTNKEIAQRLHIAPETVKRHLGNVYTKLHVHGRREAVTKARALRLLPPR